MAYKSLICFLLIIFVATVQGLSITASDVINNWTTMGDPRDGTSGTWVLSGSEVSSPDSGSKISNFTMADGTFSGSFRTTGADDDIIGFIFGFQDLSNHYRFGWDAADYNSGYADVGGTNGMRVLKEVAGSNTFLVQNSTKWQRNVLYNFSVTRTGSDISVFVGINGGATLLNYVGTDTQFMVGKVGIYTASQSPVYFSNLQVTSTPEASSVVMLVLGVLSYFWIKRL